MCRNIRVLHHMAPPSTPEEIRAAALQFVRKVSGTSGPAPQRGGEVAFAAAVDEIAASTERLLDALDALPTRSPPRTREGEREKARERWSKRARATAT
ncbi:MAG: DUF2277 domain-containing protein [Myxococcales bacterium]|jgi:hypothetical protein|nr:DUF2277 domain-containing protein [Myxococcales bacterium]MBL0194331.1 DUF2277 domain-containing protein [Myxococcales bacterium]HQY62345.1 DUF2277 domain-containing protein [Polyangiaceae bacterium]